MLAALGPEAEEALKDAAPHFACADPTDKNTCQQIREAWAKDGGVYVSDDYSGGKLAVCYMPPGVRDYRICRVGKEVSWNLAGPFIQGETLINGVFEYVPWSDDRCDKWGGPFSAAYLACVAAIPRKDPSN
jgi:hypothetical protein